MRKYSSNLAFIDLLFNLILGFVFLFVVSFLLINDPTKKDNVEAKAEYMIIMSWDADKDVDIDLWVQGPSGLVGFRQPMAGFMNLDRDDLGHRNDRIVRGPNAGEIVYLNREVVNIRGFQPGEYVVNAHYYFGRGPYQSDLSVEITVEVLKLNPYSQVYVGTKKIFKKGEERTFTRFTMKPNGYYTNVNELPKALVMVGHDLPPSTSFGQSLQGSHPGQPSSNDDDNNDDGT